MNPTIRFILPLLLASTALAQQTPRPAEPDPFANPPPPNTGRRAPAAADPAANAEII